MRKYKKVKRKEIIFSLDEWETIEKQAATLLLTTTTYIRHLILDGHITFFNIKEITSVMNALRIIGGNINQIAKKANEINSIYADDIEELRKENAELCHILSQFLSTLPSTAA